VASRGPRGRQLHSISVEGNHLERKQRKLLGRQLSEYIFGLCGRVSVDGHQLGQDRPAAAGPSGASRALDPDRVDMARAATNYIVCSNRLTDKWQFAGEDDDIRLLALGGEHEHQAYTRRSGY
jgi:hypothetical protein